MKRKFKFELNNYSHSCSNVEWQNFETGSNYWDDILLNICVAYSSSWNIFLLQWFIHLNQIVFLCPLKLAFCEAIAGNFFINSDSLCSPANMPAGKRNLNQNWYRTTRCICWLAANVNQVSKNEIKEKMLWQNLIHWTRYVSNYISFNLV